MKIQAKSIVIFDRIVDVFAVLAAIFLVFLMLLVCAEVALRYFFNMPIQGVLELSEYSLLFVSLLPAVWVMRNEGHIRIDAVIILLRPRAQHILNIVTTILCAVACLILAWYGFKIGIEHFSMNIRLSTLLMPPSYVIIVVIPVTYLLLCIQLVRRSVNSLRKGSQTVIRSLD